MPLRATSPIAALLVLLLLVRYAGSSTAPCADAPRVARAHARLAAALAQRGWAPHLRPVLAADDSGAASVLPERDGYEARFDGAALTMRARSCNGLMNAAHRLADHVAASPRTTESLLACLLSHAHASAVSAESVVIVDAPVLATRIYSDQGQLLDSPDRGFYAADGSLNASRVASDAATFLALVPTWQELGINAAAWESSGIEDFVNYDRLGSGIEVYASNNAHRVRTAAWQAALQNVTGALASEGLRSYIETFDLMYPPALAAKYNISSIHSPDLPVVLRARFGELFARLPQLDGIILYVVDSWSPRAGYEFGVLWTSIEELALTATVYFDALAVAAPGKELVFSLWVPATPLNNAWPIFRDHSPPGLAVLVNDGQGDYLWSHGINEILGAGAGRDRRLYVSCDAFRQYDGWGRLLASPSEQWAQRLRVAANTSAVGAVISAEWSPGNTWPDSLAFPQGELLNWTSSRGFKSWIGIWDRFRIFQLSDLGLFSPSSANVAVLAGLAWDPAQDTLLLIAAWAARPPLSLNPLAASLVAAAFNISGDGWMAKYITDVDEYAQEWSTVFTPKYAPNAESTGTGLVSLFTNASLPQVLAQNARVTTAFASAAELVHQALAANGSAARVAALADADGQLTNDAVAAAGGDAGAGLLLAAQKTLAHGAIFAAFRAAAWVNNSLAGATQPALRALCAELAAALEELETRVPAFGRLYAEESARWNVASADPDLDVRPDFFRLNDRSIADWLPSFRGDWLANCGGVTVAADVPPKDRLFVQT